MFWCKRFGFTIKPLDKNILDKIINENNLLITIEEGALMGGFGSSILEYYNKNPNFILPPLLLKRCYTLSC